jgi:hypothetical protein
MKQPKNQSLSDDFVVECSYPYDEKWELIGKKIESKAGKATLVGAGNGWRDMTWYVKNFEQALRMRKLILGLEVVDLECSFRERITVF